MSIKNAVKDHDYRKSNLLPYVILTVVILIIGVGAYIFLDLWLEARAELSKQKNMYTAYVKENEKWKQKQEAFNQKQVVRGVWHETSF